jgi:hypothetical protein
MKGIELSEKYYNAHGLPMIETKFGSYAHRIAVGFAGPGSECFGFDDDISRDHDWGPGFCIWLTGEDYKDIGPNLQEAYENLPKIFQGFGPRAVSPGEEARTGVSEINTFYRTYLGLDHLPKTLMEWLSIQEQALATCTNGKIFSDPLGEFSRWRKELLGFYPEDVRLKKMASRCITAAQAGQYNFGRSLKRNDLFAARHSEMTFCADVISLVFLLNKRYAPFYKWMHHALKGLPVLGKTVYNMIADLLAEHDHQKKSAIIERICSKIIEELRLEGLSDSSSDFLLDHASNIHSRIADPVLRARLTVVR